MTHTLPRPQQPALANGTPPIVARPAHHRPRRVVIALGLLLLIALGLAVAVVASRLAPPTNTLTASGTVEVDEVILAAQAAGTIADLLVDEGSRVVEGQVVGHLSDPVLNVQLQQATADAAQAQIVQAELSRLELRAPSGGVVQKRLAHRGEVVAPGTPILTVADPTDLKLTLFVPQAALGRVAVGQHVSVRTDAFAERTFAGTVQTIATRAEFTPRNVQTQQDRQNLVFGITVRLPNPDGALKAGLPVDATFEGQP